MVETKVDVIRPSVLTLSTEETDEIIALMETGKLPADYLDRCDDAREANVFGIDHKKDKQGDPIEQGLGAPGNQTANSIAAYKKYCNPDNPKAVDPDPNFAENLKRMQAELDACNEQRAASASARGRKSRRR